MSKKEYKTKAFLSLARASSAAERREMFKIVIWNLKLQNRPQMAPTKFFGFVPPFSVISYKIDLLSLFDRFTQFRTQNYQCPKQKPCPSMTGV